MPRITPYFEAHGPPPVACAAAYDNGKLAVSIDAGTLGGATVHVRDDEMVAILREPSADGFWRLVWLRETGDEAAPFELGALRLTEAIVDGLPPHVRDRHLLATVALATSASPLHVVVSTRSGVGQAQSFYDAVLAPLLDLLGRQAAGEVDFGEIEPNDKTRTYSLLVTSSSRSVSELAKRLAPADGYAPTVILLSGDGGVVDLLNGVSTDHQTVDLPTIALLPLGTGNALFHSLHRPQYTADATATTAPLVLGLRTLLSGRPTPLPSFEAAFSSGSRLVSGSEYLDKVVLLRGAIVASYGFHAQLVWESDTPAYRKHGAKRFGMAAEELLQTAHAYAASVETRTAGTSLLQPLHTRDNRFSYVLATLVSNLEKTFTISPASQPLDGQLHLVHFGAIGGARTMQVMMAAYNNGAHVGMHWDGDDMGGDNKADAVGYSAIDDLIVTVHEPDARWRKMCIDGTIVEVPPEGWMHVSKAARPVLRIIVDRQQ